MIHPCQTLNPITLPPLARIKLKNLYIKWFHSRPFRFNQSDILETFYHGFPLMNPRVFWRCVGNPCILGTLKHHGFPTGQNPLGFFHQFVHRASRALCWMLWSPSRLCSIDPWMMGGHWGHWSEANLSSQDISPGNLTYCWWTKSCTTKKDDYPIIYRVLTIPGETFRDYYWGGPMEVIGSRSIVSWFIIIYNLLMGFNNLRI